MVIPILCTPAVRHRDLLLSMFSAMLTMSRREVSCVNETSALKSFLTPVVVLPTVACLVAPGMKSFLRLLTLQVVSLIGRTPLLSLTEPIAIVTCRFLTCIALHSGAPVGISMLFIRSGLSSWNPSYVLASIARLLVM